MKIKVKKFKGTYTVMITPFSVDGKSINENALRQFVDWQIEQNIHGLIPLGSTGEFLSLTDEERYTVAKITIEQTEGRVPVLVGTAAENTWDAIRYSRQAEQLGADGLMIIPPFYSTPTDDEIYYHYKAIADAVSIPIMIYNNPATSNVDLLPKLVGRLSKIDNISYIKESTMDVTRVRDIIDICGKDMIVFGGIMGYESYLNGAMGWVSVGSNVMPKAFADMYKFIIEEENIPAAKELYRRILPMIRIVGGHKYVASSKTALSLMGLAVGNPRPPRLPSTPDDVGEIKRLLSSLNIETIKIV